MDREMNLKKTCEMMVSDDYKERFKAEYYQVILRVNGLGRILESFKQGTLEFKPKCSYELLEKQKEIMWEYASVLRERAIIEGIELD
ncbi:MAG: hypothetical protein K0S61_678 [Anaerocolumna sp.]|jgi:hypothetical protein|nr:hypothetical protein [Anaerocolumna sp.]